MGFDCGFDVCPRLEPTPENQETYRRFLDEIIERWQGVYDPSGRREDGKILEMPGEVSEHAKMECGRDQYIYFKVGECPGMPARPENCNFFLRFSSKVYDARKEMMALLAKEREGDVPQVADSLNPAFRSGSRTSGIGPPVQKSISG
ncbi:hypothetical protein RB597_001922 [Gaeumannomyces tritici]